MMNTPQYTVFILLLFWGIPQAFSQELESNVRVISEKIQQSNKSVFRELKRAMEQLLNQTQWGDHASIESPPEKIPCTFTLVIDKIISNSEFEATLSMQSSRKIFNSSYESPLFNYQESFKFSYLQGDNLRYNPNTYTSELTSCVAFYACMILGIHADTMSPSGGLKFFERAQKIVSIAGSASNKKVWLPGSGANNRFWLVDNWISPLYMGVRKAYYTYHRIGLDHMFQSLENGKNHIKEVLKLLKHHADIRPNSIPLQIFMEAKAYEISEIFSGGPGTDQNEKTREFLEGFYPAKSNVWALIQR